VDEEYTEYCYISGIVLVIPDPGKTPLKHNNTDTVGCSTIVGIDN
jgi:hypothetical protein